MQEIFKAAMARAHLSRSSRIGKEVELARMNVVNVVLNSCGIVWWQ